MRAQTAAATANIYLNSSDAQPRLCTAQQRARVPQLTYTEAHLKEDWPVLGPNGKRATHVRTFADPSAMTLSDCNLQQ
jgi:hypothetical protein